MQEMGALFRIGSGDRRIVAVKVWIRASGKEAFCFAARLPALAYDNDETEFVMDAELTPAMRAQEFEESGIRYLPAAAVAGLIRTPADLAG